MLFTSTTASAEIVSELPNLPPDVSPHLVAELERRELARQLAALHKRIRTERRWERIAKLATCWPVALGLILAAFAPAMQAYLATGFPGLLATVFPLNALFSFTDLRIPGGLGQSLPLILLYAQFPLDGLFARMFLSQRVTLTGVCAQVSFYHFLGSVYIFLVSGAYYPLLTR